ncbi:MAG: AMP-binding protein [Actinobacteria bacterium]|nr:AMP-binding protein [Actinomycetota bacterium]
MNLAEKLTAASGAHADAVAVRWRDETLTHGELADRVARLAGGFAGLGVGAGDRVGIACANNPYFVVAYLATLWGGGVAVPVNPNGAPEEIARELDGTGAKVAVVGPAGRKAVDAARDAAALGDVTVVDAGSSAEHAAGGALAFDDLLTSEALALVARAADDAAVLAHTSGTSGSPKAAILTHGNLASNIDQALAHPTLHVDEGDVALGVLPLFHSYGLNAVLGLALATGGQVVLEERFDPHGDLGTIRECGVTVVAGVPPMFAAWLGLPDVPADAFSGVRVAMSGAAPLPTEVQEGFKRRFGIPLHQGYGLTEAAPIVSTTGMEGDPPPGSIGIPLPGVEVRLVDTDGEDALVGDPGEIWVRGANVFAGYWEDEEATKRVLTSDGWLMTGDVAVASDDGFLTIVDRSKDLIIVSGFNVYPAEVEEVLLRHEGVAEAAVVGVPHPHTGEGVKAFVVPAPGAHLDEEELVAHCGRSLARYKAPASVEFVDQLPRGLAGKLLRRELV